LDFAPGVDFWKTVSVMAALTRCNLRTIWAAGSFVQAFQRLNRSAGRCRRYFGNAGTVSGPPDAHISVSFSRKGTRSN